MNLVLKTFKSFSHAFHGFFYAFSKETNLKLELLAAVMVYLAAWVVKVEVWEAVALTFCVFSVLILELLNTILERLVNLFKPRIHPYAKVIKDMMAAAVLLASLSATIVGILIFSQYL